MAVDAGAAAPDAADSSTVRERITAARRAILARRSAEERRALAEIKRLSERCRGDLRTLEAIREGPEQARAVADRLGLTIDPQDAARLVSRWMAGESPAADAASPLERLWADYWADWGGMGIDGRAMAACPQANPRFDAWRSRQLRRCDAQFGGHGKEIMHSVLTFELSSGCSVGCWFCGISAERFRGHFPYTPENADLWRAMLRESVGLFGTAAGSGFCYWGTDPSDNPDYPDFINDFAEITGTLPPTTTAVPLRDLALTRRILALERVHGFAANRFSILNLKMLERVHAAFSPEELFEVELVMQNAEAATPRALAGRARDRRPALNAETEAKRGMEGSTIACVSGFLVNMVERSVRLITPVPASERWPLGYRTYETARFDDASDFGAAMRGMIERHMPSSPRPDEILRLRPDVACTPSEDGFTLTSRGSRFSIGGSAAARRLGELAEAGVHTAREVRRQLGSAGADPFAAMDLIQQLFDRGLLDEEADRPAEPEAIAAE